MRQVTLRTSSSRAWLLSQTPRLRVHSKPLLMARASTLPVSDKEKLDFVAKLRKSAMKLHKPPPKKAEGEEDSSPKPFEQWEITVESYLKFLVESRRVYTTVEDIIENNDSYSLFRDTGLDRVDALNRDIAWISAEYDLPVRSVSEDGLGATYAKELRHLSVTNVPLFICHFYNFYLAHTAGGRMIGKKAADMALNGAFERLAFYQYNSDMKMLVNNFKRLLNTVAQEWTNEERDRSIEETPKCFEWNGAVMKTLFSQEG